MCHRTLTSSHCSCRLPLDVDSRLLPAVAVEVGHGRQATSRVPRPAVPAFRLPDAAAFCEAAGPASSPLPWPSPRVHGSALLCPWRGPLPALQGARPGTDSWLAPPARRESSASAPFVAPAHWAPATWLSGDDHDRTFPGKQTVTFQAHQPFVRPPSSLLTVRQRAEIASRHGRPSAC